MGEDDKYGEAIPHVRLGKRSTWRLSSFLRSVVLRHRPAWHVHGTWHSWLADVPYKTRHSVGMSLNINCSIAALNCLRIRASPSLVAVIREFKKKLARDSALQVQHLFVHL